MEKSSTDFDCFRPFIKDIFQSIAAKADGEPCCDWVGPEGAGHYVKVFLDTIHPSSFSS